MAKLKSTLLNMVASLFVVSLLSSGALGGVYLLTKDAIVQAKLQTKIKAFRSVLPAFDNNPYEERYVVATSQGELVLYPARQSGVWVGTAVDTFSLKGYSGKIAVLVGFRPDGSIHDALITEHRETPGLGSKLDPAQSPFSRQFQGRDPAHFRLSVRKDGGDIDAITAATVSSRAYCEALRLAYEVFMREGVRDR